MNILEGLEKTLHAVLSQAKKDKVIGPVKCRFSTAGNKETMQDTFEKIAKEICEAMGFIYGNIHVVYDDEGFTRISINCYDSNKIVEYIDELVKRDKLKQNPRQMLNAFNKTITIADHFNNMFGEGIHNKTKELNEINEIYDLMKDIFKK